MLLPFTMYYTPSFLEFGTMLETRYLSASPEKNKGNNASCPYRITSRDDVSVVKSYFPEEKELFEFTRREFVTARLNFPQDIIGTVLTDTQKGTYPSGLRDWLMMR